MVDVVDVGVWVEVGGDSFTSGWRIVAVTGYWNGRGASRLDVVMSGCYDWRGIT